VFFYNGGAGVAVVRSVDFKVCITGDDQAEADWRGYIDVFEMLEASGLVRGRDFLLSDNGAGLPLVPNTRREESTMLAAFGSDALRKVLRFDIRIRVRDGVGDVHERVLDVVDRIRRVSPTQIDTTRADGPGEG